MNLSDFWNEFIASINSAEINTYSSVFKLCLSLVLGSVVGIERKRKGQIAGVRTFALIAMGATLAMILSVYVPQVYLGLNNGDPARIAAQVVTGIGFLGAGAIIQMKGSVRGLTTAAGIWMVAAIGMAVGVGLYIVAIVATALILFILVQLERFERRANLDAESRVIHLSLSVILDDIKPYAESLLKHDVQLIDEYVEYDYTLSTTTLNLVVLAREKADYVKIFADLSKINPTISVSLGNHLSI